MNHCDYYEEKKIRNQLKFFRSKEIYIKRKGWSVLQKSKYGNMTIKIDLIFIIIIMNKQ